MKQRLSIFLAKKGIADDSQLLDLGRMREAKPLSIPGTESVIYIHQPRPARYADWVDYLVYSQIGVNHDFFSKSQSESAVIVSRMDEYVFLITFGGGHHKVIKDNIEKDFGLRVTLNSVDPKKLKSLDKSNYQDTPLNMRNQSAKQVDINSLNIDSEMEILSTLTGKSNVDIFGEIVTGKDSLMIIPSVNITSLSKILTEALDRFKRKLPKELEWIDNISKVKDRELYEVLISELDDHLSDASRHEQFWVGEPELVDWDNQIGYVIGRVSARSEIHLTLSFSKLKDYLYAKGITLNCEYFEKYKNTHY